MMTKVPPELELTEVLSHVLARHMDVRAPDRTLQQRPEAFNRVRVHIATCPLFLMVIDGLVLVTGTS